MKARTLSLVFLSSSILVGASYADNFPIKINCTDLNNGDGEKLSIKISPLTNDALFSYESKNMEKPIAMHIADVGGYNSSSSVSIKRTASGRLNSRGELTIAAHETEIYRVTQYANFSLLMTQNNAGQFVPQKLEYEKGIDAFPESQIKGTLALSHLTCSLTGL